MAEPPSDPPPQPLAGRHVLVGVGGGIACYKVCEIVSKLVQQGCRVTVAMTPAAQKFVTPLTFEALSSQPVHTDIWQGIDPTDTQHIGLTEQADLLLIAPATQHLLCKIALGLCDDLVSLLAAAAACPILFAPSMNSRMWENPATVEAVEKLKARGHAFVGPTSGWLACRNVGSGRLAEAGEILEAVTTALSRSTLG
jgi:phosphopantothenoylcysteine decarboxylase/phosphopantothenate--cysteine ligase